MFYRVRATVCLPLVPPLPCWVWTLCQAPGASSVANTRPDHDWVWWCAKPRACWGWSMPDSTMIGLGGVPSSALNIKSVNLHFNFLSP